MESLITALGPLITQQNIAIVVLGLMCAACGWLHIVWRREDREERKGLHSCLDRNSDALNGVERAIAVLSERVK